MCTALPAPPGAATAFRNDDGTASPASAAVSELPEWEVMS
eukprot:COSAG01_NODE_72986_length_251_cov_1.019737_1_plen_39_part_01